MTLEELRRNRPARLSISLFCGFVFGFLLQKGGVTNYDVVIGQLLLKDFTVVKVMLSAVIVGSLGIHALRSIGLVTLHPKPGSIGSSVPGSLLFGFGFAVLGYCPGTVVGAAGSGSMDALLGGIAGMLLGSGLFAAAYPLLDRKVLKKGHFGTRTIPEALGVDPWVVVIIGSLVLAGLLRLVERAGL